MKFFRSPIIRALILFALGFSLSTAWSRYHHPIQPLYVDIYNGTAATLPDVIIQHGKANLQERIQVLQLAPGEHRIISLNHEPGLGFNVEATLENGKVLTICAGKGDALLVRASITTAGIIPMPVR